MASQNDGSAPVLLPTDRYESYMYSKRDTNEVLDWLRTNASKKEDHYQFDLKLTLSDIRYAAKRVVARNVEVPSHIQNAFKRLLRDRSKLTAWFRQVETVQGKAQSASTDAHKAFNDTLTQVYHIMFPGDDKVYSNQQYRQPLTSTNDPRNSDNLYNILAKLMEEESSDRNLDTQAQRPKENILQRPKDDEVSDYIIEGDPLRDKCEAMSWLLELDIGCSLVQRWFEEVRDNKMSIVLAATLTLTLARHFLATDRLNNSKKGIGRCGEVLHLIYERLEQDIKSCGCPRSTGMRPQDDDQGNHGADTCYKFRNGTSLVTFGCALDDFISRKQKPDFLGSVERRPIQTCFSTLAEGSDQERVCSMGAACCKLDYEGCISIFKSLWNLHLNGPKDQRVLPTVFVNFVNIVEKHNRGCDVPDCSCNTCPPIPHSAYLQTSIVWYVQIILESARSFIRKDGKPSTVNCRIQTLRLSQEILASVENVMAINTEDSRTFGHRTDLRNRALRRLTQKVLATPRFDLLHQSPLIAGEESSHLLDFALENGLALLDENGMFGTVLYFYKVCQFVTGNDKPNPVLDNLCDIFLESVFMGEFPTKNFELLYLRFRKMHRKLSKDSGRKGGSARRELDWDKIEWVGDGPQDRISHSNISFWHELNEQSLVLDGKFWACLAGIDKKKRLSSGVILQVERVMRTEPLAKVFSHLEEALSKEFDEGSKVARINFFKVYELAVRTLQTVGQKSMELFSEPINMPSSVEVALFDLDEKTYVKDEQIEFGDVTAFLLFKMIDENKNQARCKLRELQGLVRESIGEVWGDVNMESLHWKYI